LYYVPSGVLSCGFVNFYLLEKNFMVVLLAESSIKRTCLFLATPCFSNFREDVILASSPWLVSNYVTEVEEYFVVPIDYVKP